MTLHNLSIIIAYYKNTNKDYSNLNNFGKKITNSNNDFIVSHNSIQMLHDGKIYNPPFYLNILIADDEKEYTNDKINLVYNMLLIGGKLIISKKYENMCMKIGSTNFEKQLNDLMTDYVVFQKKTNMVIKPHKKGTPPVDFIIMGTQKSGTTSAQKNLTLHPEISFHKEEIHYFDIYLSKGLEWYKRHFDYSKKIVGEKTPDLMYMESTFPYIQSLNPSLKIIIFLRNPIHRAYSSWKMIKYNYGEHRSFEECILEEKTYRIGENKNLHTASFHYLQRGLYYEQISNILKWFPIQNVLIMLFEKMIVDTKNEYNKIYDFLGVKHIEIEYSKERIGSDDTRVNPQTYDELISFFKDDVEKLEKLIGYKTNWF